MNENEDLAAEKARLELEVARLRAERDYGVPVSLLGAAKTADAVAPLAQEILAWRDERPAAPPVPVAPSYQVGQISRSTLAYMTPGQISQAYQQGRLQQIGGKPSPNGQAH